MFYSLSKYLTIPWTVHGVAKSQTRLKRLSTHAWWPLFLKIHLFVLISIISPNGLLSSFREVTFSLIKKTFHISGDLQLTQQHNTEPAKRWTDAGCSFFLLPFSPFKKFLFYFGVYLTYNVVLVSGVHQSDSVTHISILLQILFPCRLLQSIKWSSLCYTGGHYWWSTLYTVVAHESPQQPTSPRPEYSNLCPRTYWDGVDQTANVKSATRNFLLCFLSSWSCFGFVLSFTS